MGATGLVHTTMGYSLAVAASAPGQIALYLASSELVTLLAPPALRGRYHGAWGTALDGAMIAAPLLSGWAMRAGGNALAGGMTLVCGLTGAALCLPLYAALKGRRST